MALAGGGRSGTVSATPGLYGGYQAGVTAAPAGYVVAPSRLLAQASAPAAALTLPYTQTWTGADGDPWPSEWTKSVLGAADIQSNTGQLTAGPGGGYDGTLAYLAGMPATADVEMLVDVTAVSAGVEQYPQVALRTDSTMSATRPANGYSVFLCYDATTPANSFLQIERQVGGSSAAIGFYTLTLTGGVTYRVRFKAVGADLSVKVWPAAGAEPGAWSWTYTDPTPYLTPGRVMLGQGNGADGATRSARFDNLTVDVAFTSTTAIASGSITLGGTVSGAVTAAATGTIILGGTGTARASTTASAAVALGGSAAATAGATLATAAGTLALNGTAAATVAAVGTGTVALAGSAGPQGRGPATGTISLGGSATATARATASGAVTLGGAVTARVQGTATGSLALSGSADGAAATVPDTYHPHVYVTATLAPNAAGTAILAGDGTSTATISDATVGGFGLDFGESFGGATATGPATAVLTSGSPATATLSGNGVGTATLASNGTSTATLTEVPASAELQLV